MHSPAFAILTGRLPGNLSDEDFKLFFRAVDEFDIPTIVFFTGSAEAASRGEMFFGPRQFTVRFGRHLLVFGASQPVPDELLKVNTGGQGDESSESGKEVNENEETATPQEPGDEAKGSGAFDFTILIDSADTLDDESLGEWQPGFVIKTGDYKEKAALADRADADDVPAIGTRGLHRGFFRLIHIRDSQYSESRLVPLAPDNPGGSAEQ